MADVILVVHFLWAAWMIFGFLLALLGFRWNRLWGWRTFRWAHILGLAATATTPFWASGICPLTEWEWQLRPASSQQAMDNGNESFIIQWISDTLFLDVEPIILSLVTGAVALITLIIFILRPPWKYYSEGKAGANSVSAP